MAESNPDVREEQTGGKRSILDNKAVAVGAIILAQTLLAIGLTQFMILPRLGIQNASLADDTVEEMAAAALEAGEIVGLKEIIVTLDSNPARPHYLRINVSLELRNGKAATRAAKRIPQLRDIVIMTLSRKTVDDLSTPEGKRNLRDEIHREVTATAERYGEPGNYVAGANICGFQKVARAMIDQGVG